jgi:hypothetical protein
LKNLANRGRLAMMHATSTLRAGSRSLHDSFTDLAAQISRIPAKYCRSLDDLSKSMEEEDEEEIENEGSESEHEGLTFFFIKFFIYQYIVIIPDAEISDASEPREESTNPDDEDVIMVPIFTLSCTGISN